MQVENRLNDYFNNRNNNLNNNNLKKLNTSNYCQVLNSIKQVLKMLTTKDYKLAKAPSQEKLNLNYEAVGQLSDQKSHRFFRFGLRLHLSVENLNNCESQNQNQIQYQNQNQNQNQLLGHENHQPALSYSPSSKRSSPCSSPPSSWSENYLQNHHQSQKGGPLPHWYSKSPPQSLASSPRSSSSTLSGLGVNGVRELTWDTANMEQHLKNRVSQFAGSHLSKIRLGIPEKVKGLIDNGRDYAREHPVTFVTLIALLLSCSVPVLAFLFFAISTVAVTFLGFLFVEGTILTVASVALTTTLLLVAFTTLTLTSLFMLAYVTLNASIKLVTGSPIGQSNPINAFMQFLSPSSEPTFSSAGSTTGSEEDEDDLEGHSDVDIQELSGCEDDEEEEENPKISLTNNKLCTPDHDSDVDAQLEDLLH